MSWHHFIWGWILSCQSYDVKKTDLRSASVSFILFIFSHFFRCISSLFLKCKMLFSASVMYFLPLSSCLLLSGLSLFRSLAGFSASLGVLILSWACGAAAGVSIFGGGSKSRAGAAGGASSSGAVGSSSSSSISPSSRSISSSFFSWDSSSALLLKGKYIVTTWILNLISNQFLIWPLKESF